VSTPTAADQRGAPPPAERGPGPGAPRRVGPFVLEGELARGGFGAVYAARDPRLGRRVAVKVAHVHALDPEDLARLGREAQAAARLDDHPGIVRVLDVGVEGGRPWIASELVEGRSLQDALREGPLGSRRVAELGRDLAAALAHAHARGILHRDLKPANVLLRPDGRPAVTDFGLAKDLLRRGQSLTETGTALGTPGYMAPEQAAGETRRTGSAADVYGLGATLYAALTGRPPFEGPGIVAVLHAVARTPPAPPRSVEPGVDPALEAIVLRCLAKAPADRFASAADLGAALAAWLERPAGAAGGGRATRLAAWAGRHTWPLRLGAGALVFFAALVAVASASAVERARAAVGRADAQAATPTGAGSLQAGRAAFWAGREVATREAFDRAVRLAAAAGDRTLEATVRLARAEHHRLYGAHELAWADVKAALALDHPEAWPAPPRRRDLRGRAHALRALLRVHVALGATSPSVPLSDVEDAARTDARLALEDLGESALADQAHLARAALRYYAAAGPGDASTTRQERYVAALAELDRACEVAPRSAEAFHTRAWIALERYRASQREAQGATAAAERAWLDRAEADCEAALRLWRARFSYTLRAEVRWERIARDGATEALLADAWSDLEQGLALGDPRALLPLVRLASLDTPDRAEGVFTRAYQAARRASVAAGLRLEVERLRRKRPDAEGAGELLKRLAGVADALPPELAAEVGRAGSAPTGD